MNSARTHTYARACAHTETHRNAHAHAHAHARTHTHTHTYTHKHTRIHTHTHTHTHTGPSSRQAAPVCACLGCAFNVSPLTSPCKKIPHPRPCDGTHRRVVCASFDRHGDTANRYRSAWCTHSLTHSLTHKHTHTHEKIKSNFEI